MRTPASNTAENKRKLLARIRRIAGQAKALEKAFERDVNRMSLLPQIAAVHGAINGLMAEVVAEHLQEHVAVLASTGRRHEDLEPLLRVLRSYLK